MAKKKTKKKSKKAVKKTSAKTPRKKPAASSGTSPSAKPSSPFIADVEYLMDLMSANDISEIEIDDGKCLIAMKRGSAAVAPVAATPTVAAAPVAFAPAAAAQAAAAPEVVEEASDNLINIVSPIVGTFYAAPSPDSDPFVKTGAKIGEDTVVCIVEAMKVMNEIKAECKGTIAEVCVENAEPVEFGQVMFRVNPA